MYRYFIVQNKLLHHFVAKLFEKQRTHFYYNWLSFIEDFLRSLLVFFMGHSVYIYIYCTVGLLCFHSVYLGTATSTHEVTNQVSNSSLSAERPTILATT